MGDLKPFMSRSAAQAAGHIVSTNHYPWRTIKGNGADPYRPHGHEVRTDLEAQLAEALEAVEWGFVDRDGEARCPLCFSVQENDDHTPGIHLEVCKLSLALKAFRGETS